MSKPDVLAVAKLHPFFQKSLEAAYTVHDRTHVTDPAAFAQLAPRIVAVAATGESQVPADLLAHLRASSGNPKVRVILGGPIFLIHDVSPISLGADAIFTDAREAVGAVKQLVRSV